MKTEDPAAKYISVFLKRKVEEGHGREDQNDAVWQGITPLSWL